jgi:hypothetical protein
VDHVEFSGLVENPKHLKEFDPARGCLLNYLMRVGAHYMNQRLRCERARAARVKPLRKKPVAAYNGAATPLSLMLEDVLSNAGSMEHPPSRACMKETKKCLAQCCTDYLNPEGNAEAGDFVVSAKRHRGSHAKGSPGTQRKRRRH